MLLCMTGCAPGLDPDDPRNERALREQWKRNAAMSEAGKGWMERQEMEKYLKDVRAQNAGS